MVLLLRTSYEKIALYQQWVLVINNTASAIVFV